jgi:hypothetical protein
LGTIATTAWIAALRVLSSGGSSSVKQKQFTFRRTPLATSPDGIESARHQTDRHASEENGLPIYERLRPITNQQPPIADLEHPYPFSIINGMGTY